MPGYLEAIVLLFPRDAGGRASAVSPRDGNYRPFAHSEGGPMLRLRFIEGPPSIAPGESARVVAEIEEGVVLASGAELDLFEHDARTGVLTISRVVTFSSQPSTKPFV